MALRNIKITRDIVQTCNKLRTFSKTDLCGPPSHKAARFSNITTKNVHNDLKENQNESQNLAEIYINKHINGNIEEPLTKLINKTRSIAATARNKSIFNKVKNLGVRTSSFRNISRSPRLATPTRFYSSHKKKAGEESCKPLSKKCPRNPNCPRFVMECCPPSKGSDCKRLYKDPCCTKKLAPYPSYSELCAYRLEDDPSECHQCPWQRCGGVDDIKPQKKSYHTSTKPINMAMIPNSINSPEFPPFMFHQECDARKEPCKEPPPKCKKREEIKKKQEQCPEKKKEKKKCPEMFVPVETWVISGSMQNLDLQRHYFDKARLARIQAEMNLHPHLARKNALEMKDCPKKRPKCPPKRKMFPPDVDHRIDERYKPKDPCCEEAKKGHQERKKPKIYVPEPRNY